MKNHAEVVEQYNKFIPGYYEKFPVTLVRGSGSYLEDVNGKKYIDMLAGYGVLNFGHNHPRLRQTLNTQFGRVGLVTGNFYNEVVAEFAEKLVNFCGLPQSQVLLANGGAEAVEKAIKICRRWGYRVKGVRYNQAEILVTNTNFHGRTYGVLSASMLEKYRQDFWPFMSGFKHVGFGDEGKFGSLAHLQNSISENTVAFLVEPIQGEGGFIFPSDGYLKKAEEICRANNVLFVLDEIPTAFGRIGSDFPHFHYGVKPDMVILGKAIGGGLPLSVVVASTEVMSVLDPGSDGSTFGGNPLAAAMGLEVISLTQEEHLAEKSKVLGGYFLRELQKIKSAAVKEVRGLGLFIGMELKECFSAKEVKAVCEQLIKNGVVTAPARGNVVRFTPPLNITKGEVNDALEIIDHIFRIDLKVGGTI